MTCIVRTTYRYKHPPRRKKPVALEVPAVVKATDPAKVRKRARADLPPKPVVSTSIKRAGASAAPPVPAANDDHRPALATKPSVVTTSGKPREKTDRPHLPMALPLSRKPVERDGDDYKRLKAAMARRLRGE